MRLRSPIGSMMFLALACNGNANTQQTGDDDPRPPNVDRGTVAMGVARLSARHVAALLKLLSDDTTCGFSSDAVKSAVQLSGQPGDDGTATWTVAGCTIDVATEKKLDSDCDGRDLLVRGAVTVTATRTVHGVLQKGTSQPVAPDAENSATFTLQQVTFKDFMVRQTTTEDWMTLNSGTLSVTAVPQLAPDHKTGVCTVATPQLTLHQLTLADAKMLVVGQGRSFHLSVPSATLELQIGPGPEHENWLEGQLIAWETRVNLPIPSDTDGLQPGYTRDGFVASYACSADLQHPLGGVCPPPRERPAQGAAALSVQLFAAVARLLDEDSRCGFANAGLTGTTSTAVGDKGPMVWTLPAPCTLRFSPGSVVDTDCNGKKTMLEGSVTITGTKTLSGYVVGDPAEPVVPTSSRPVTFDLVLKPSELRVSTSGSDNAMLAHGGMLSGTLQPMTGLDTTAGACSIATPIAHLTFAHQGFSADLDTGDTTVAVTLDSSMLEAQTGSEGDKTNYLAGEAMAGSHMLSVPSAGAAPVLDPDYDPSTFQKSFMCTANLQMPATEDDCKLARKLGEASARLMVSDTAAAVKLVNADARCGFENQDNVLVNGFNVVGQQGQPGSVTWATAGNCGVGVSGGPKPWTTDCDGVATTLEGTAVVKGNRTVKGVRYDVDCGIFCTAPAVHPTPEDCATFQVTVQFQSFAASTADGRLIIHSGTLATTARPLQGQDMANGDYDIGTPVGGFDNIDFMGGAVTLVSGPKTFNFTLGQAHLSAFNGAFKGNSNSLSGSINVDGVDLMLGMLKLQPSYDQGKFDHSYACTMNLKATLPP
jgi:hypothetical protein